MRAINISVDEFIKVLNMLKRNNVDMIDLDMIKDERNATMNKLVIHPVRDINSEEEEFNNLETKSPNKIEIRDPNFNTENNDIFKAFDDIL